MADAIAHEDAHGVAMWNYYKTNGLRYDQVMHINNEECTRLLALKDVTRARFMDSPQLWDVVYVVQVASGRRGHSQSV
eukprot:SAG22_NODE_1266_length_4956_cov_3.272184_4_plen_78_part_00